MENDLLCASGLSPENKIEERISFAQCHARLYLTVSYDDQDDKSAAANTFNISCGGSVCFPFYQKYQQGIFGSNNAWFDRPFH